MESIPVQEGTTAKQCIRLNLTNNNDDAFVFSIEVSPSNNKIVNTGQAFHYFTRAVSELTRADLYTFCEQTVTSVTTALCASACKVSMQGTGNIRFVISCEYKKVNKKKKRSDTEEE